VSSLFGSDHGLVRRELIRFAGYDVVGSPINACIGRKLIEERCFWCCILFVSLNVESISRLGQIGRLTAIVMP
jgi:hypothetical protein